MANQSRTELAGGSAAAAACIALLALLAPPAWGQPTNPFGASPDVWIYHSRGGDGYYDGTSVLPLGTHTLGIWATGGAVASETGATLCTDTSSATGQELCALDIDFQLSGAGQLVSFTPAEGLVAGSFVSSAGRRLRVNVASGTNPLRAGFPPARIGDLTVAVTGGDTVVSIAGVAGLGPDTAPHPISPHVEFVPEPGSWLLMVSALAGLAGLHALRRALAR
jgi:hypothetical protein